MGAHKDSTLSNNHSIVAESYADIAARDNDTEWNTEATNVDKVIKITGTSDYYILASNAPTWTQLS